MPPNDQEELKRLIVKRSKEECAGHVVTFDPKSLTSSQLQLFHLIPITENDVMITIYQLQLPRH